MSSVIFDAHVLENDELNFISAVRGGNSARLFNYMLCRQL
jgi:hypothetical protein